MWSTPAKAQLIRVLGIAAVWIGGVVCLSAHALADASEQIVLMPWTRFCLHSPTDVDHKTCFTETDARMGLGTTCSQFNAH
jgi:hypothetical protein